MAAKADFQRLLDKIGAEDVGGQINSIPVVPETGAKKKKDSSTGAGDFEFRPLTQEEKQEFVDSLDAKGRQILAEFESKLKVSSDAIDFSRVAE